MIAVVFTSACSFIGVRGPESRGAECSTNRTAPIVDTVIAVGSAVGATAGFISASKNCMHLGEDDFCGSKLIAGTLVVLGIPYALSAFYGHTTVSRCRRFRQAQAREAAAPAPPE